MEHYFSSKPVSKDNEGIFEYLFNGHMYSFISNSGVFSKSSVDFGTDLMLKTFAEKTTVQSLVSGTKVLDVGCGLGVVGVVLGKILPQASITMFDINERAVVLSRRNLSKNHVGNAKVICSDLFQNIDEKYNIIFSNPPIRAGKKVVFDIYQASFEHLEQGGCFYVVIQKKQGAQSSIERLELIFGNCETIEKKAGYKILKCVKGSV